jgi:hypothetical protein
VNKNIINSPPAMRYSHRQKQENIKDNNNEEMFGISPEGEWKDLS